LSSQPDPKLLAGCSDAILEKAEELQVPAEVIVAIQTLLQLMDNVNYRHSMDQSLTLS